MKVKILHLLALGALLQLGVVVESSGQDGLPNPEFSGYPVLEAPTDEDKPLLYEHDLKNPRILRDTSTSRSVSTFNGKTKASTTTVENRKVSGSRGDDALNFNFLYYIIHKFKSSDLIDE